MLEDINLTVPVGAHGATSGDRAGSCELAQVALLLDESFGALDARTQARLQHGPRRIWLAESMIMTLATHDGEESVYLIDPVVMMAPANGPSGPA